MTLPRNPMRWIVAFAVMLGISALSLRHYFPPLPNPITLDLHLDPAATGKSEPLITSGRLRAADLLFVRSQEDGTVTFGYETWGSAGQFSAPIPLPADRRLRLIIEMPGLSQ